MHTDQLIQLLESQDLASWSQTLFALAHAHGFERTLFGVVESRHSPLEQAFVCSNYPEKWSRQYTEQRLAYVDPTVLHCFSSNLPLLWGAETFKEGVQRELYEEASANGVRAGVALPVHGPGGEFGVLSFVVDARMTPDLQRAMTQTLPILSLIRDFAFASSRRFCTEPAAVAPKLTVRELEVLKWVMVGKSSWEISRIISCSEATVNFHMANVRQKFNVTTRQQAVVKAIALGLITPEDHHR